MQSAGRSNESKRWKRSAMMEEITITVLNGEVVIWPTNEPEPGRLELRDEMVVTIASCELAGPEQGQAFVWKVEED